MRFVLLGKEGTGTGKVDESTEEKAEGKEKSSIGIWGDWASFLLLRSSPVLEGTVDASIDGSEDDEPERQEGESSNNWASVAEVKCTVGTGTGTGTGTGNVTVDAGEVKGTVDESTNNWASSML